VPLDGLHAFSFGLEFILMGLERSLGPGSAAGILRLMLVVKRLGC